MDARADDAPEVAPPPDLEVAARKDNPTAPSSTRSQYSSLVRSTGERSSGSPVPPTATAAPGAPTVPPKTNPSPRPPSILRPTLPITYAVPPSPLPYITENPADQNGKGRKQRASSKKKRRTASPIGCLHCVVALLLVAAIALGVSTGILAERVKNGSAQLDSNTNSPAASPTTTAEPATTTAYDSIDDGCTSNPSGVTGTTYRSYPVFGNLNFTIYCGMDSPNKPILSLFTADFNTCMDACASYSKYIGPDFAGIFRNNSSSIVNASCAGVTFVPLWTSKASAAAAEAAGNCFLKPGPLTASSLTTPKTSTETHAGVVA